MPTEGESTPQSFQRPNAPGVSPANSNRCRDTAQEPLRWSRQSRGAPSTVHPRDSLKTAIHNTRLLQSLLFITLPKLFSGVVLDGLSSRECASSATHTMHQFLDTHTPRPCGHCLPRASSPPSVL